MNIYEQCIWVFWICGGLGSALVGLIAEAKKMAPKGRLRKK